MSAAASLLIDDNVWPWLVLSMTMRKCVQVRHVGSAGGTWMIFMSGPGGEIPRHAVLKNEVSGKMRHFGVIQAS